MRIGYFNKLLNLQGSRKRPRLEKGQENAESDKKEDDAKSEIKGNIHN